jgi:hypothetical protein
MPVQLRPLEFTRLEPVICDFCVNILLLKEKIMLKSH